MAVGLFLDFILGRDDGLPPPPPTTLRLDFTRGIDPTIHTVLRLDFALGADPDPTTLRLDFLRGASPDDLVTLNLDFARGATPGNLATLRLDFLRGSLAFHDPTIEELHPHLGEARWITRDWSREEEDKGYIEAEIARKAWALLEEPLRWANETASSIRNTLNSVMAFGTQGLALGLAEAAAEHFEEVTGYETVMDELAAQVRAHQFDIAAVLTMATLGGALTGVARLLPVGIAATGATLKLIDEQGVVGMLEDLIGLNEAMPEEFDDLPVPDDSMIEDVQVALSAKLDAMDSGTMLFGSYWKRRRWHRYEEESALDD